VSASDQNETPPFTDVSFSAYYYLAAKWAKDSGIAMGVGDGRLDPSGCLTREQAFAFVCRAYPSLTAAADLTGIESANSLDRFIDAGTMSDYAVRSAEILISFGIVEGTDAGTLLPKAELTRAQMTKILSVTLDKARGLTSEI